MKLKNTLDFCEEPFRYYNVVVMCIMIDTIKDGDPTGFALFRKALSDKTANDKFWSIKQFKMFIDFFDENGSIKQSPLHHFNNNIANKHHYKLAPYLYHSIPKIPVDDFNGANKKFEYFNEQWLHKTFTKPETKKINLWKNSMVAILESQAPSSIENS